MRKIIFYISAFWLPIILLLVGLAIYFGLNVNFQFISFNKKEDFLIQLLATLIGVGVSIFVAEGFKKIEQRKRIKKSFGFKKLLFRLARRKILKPRDFFNPRSGGVNIGCPASTASDVRGRGCRSSCPSPLYFRRKNLFIQQKEQDEESQDSRHPLVGI